MVRKLVISNEAISDLDEIWDYIARDSPMKADSFINKIYQRCVDLSELDGVGRTRVELYPNFLSVPFRKYVIFFQRTESGLQIVRILHGARDLGAMFEE
ncbi:MAG: toxin ParE1/3/4 [Candidatus Pelagisphaera sp.]